MTLTPCWALDEGKKFIQVFADFDKPTLQHPFTHHLESAGPDEVVEMVPIYQTCADCGGLEMLGLVRRIDLDPYWLYN